MPRTAFLEATFKIFWGSFTAPQNPSRLNPVGIAVVDEVITVSSPLNSMPLS